MIKSNTLPVVIQHRIDLFIADRIADNLSRKDAIEVLSAYIEVKTEEKIGSTRLWRWVYEGAAIPKTKLLAITNSFST